MANLSRPIPENSTLESYQSELVESFDLSEGVEVSTETSTVSSGLKVEAVVLPEVEEVVVEDFSTSSPDPRPRRQLVCQEEVFYDFLFHFSNLYVYRIIR